MKNWIKKTFKEWPWITILSPIWAIACILNSITIFLYTDSYLSIPAYQVKFAAAPWWLWAGAYLIISVMVLIKKDAFWTVLQASITITDAIAIFFSTFSPNVSPLAGSTLMVIGLTLWIGMVKRGFKSERDISNSMRQGMDE